MSTAGPPFSYPPMPLGRPSQVGEPTWELASLFPHQGNWTESKYLALDRRERRMYELVHGRLEVLPMPTVSHQRIALYLYKLLDNYVQSRRIGTVLVAPCPVHLGQDHYREPDVFFVRPEQVTSMDSQPEGADLVIEVVSPDLRDRNRDLIDKRRDYAQAGIPEYWIVDPQEQQLSVLVLDGVAYRDDQVCKPGEIARSILLPGFEVDVEATLAGRRHEA